MTQVTLELRFPMPRNITNWASGGSNWRARAAAKKLYFTQLDLMQQAGLLPVPPAKPFTSATLASVMRLGNAMDDDNAMARHKFPLDWLKTRGYIADDRRQNLRWVGIPAQIVARKQDYSITLTLAETERP